MGRKKLWEVTDGNGNIEVMAASDGEAAQIWVQTGDYPDHPETWWIHLAVRRAYKRKKRGDFSSVSVEVPPDEPECTESKHKWVDEQTRCNGGGVIITDTCEHCGVKRIINTWAQDRETGSQGLTSVRYEI